VDVYRYFLLRCVAFGLDGDFSHEMLHARYNNDLANGIGNLASRTLNMVGRYFDGVVPSPGPTGETEHEVLLAGAALRDSAAAVMEGCQFHTYLEQILTLVDATNRYIDVTQPFKLAKDASQKERLATILYTCAEAVRVILLYLAPVMPQASARGLALLGWQSDGGRLSDDGAWGRLAPGSRAQKAEALFPRKA
jgi:methionyl-tRNA synthetase